MSLWKNLFTLGEGYSVAHNAHLAELVIENHLPVIKRRDVVRSMLNVMRRGWDYRDMEVFMMLMAFNKFSRITQLNMLSIAMHEMGIGYPGEQWMKVSNPIHHTMDEKDLAASAAYFKRVYGITVTVGSQPIDVNRWMDE